MPKLLKFNEKALKALLKGVKKLSQSVVVTLGPKGHHVIIQKEYGSPLLTKDGITVANEISLKDKFENMGVQAVKEAAAKTAETAGDGTTTSIALAEALFSAGVKNAIAGLSPILLKKGMDKALKAILKNLEAMAKPIKTKAEIQQIATLSANGDEKIGALIGEAMDKAGKNGIITIAEAKSMETTLEIVEGLELSSGYLSPYFVTNGEKMSAEMENALIFITDKKLSSAQDIVKILEKAFSENQEKTQPLLIIAEEIESEALTTLVLNKIKGSMSLCAVKAPGFGENRKALLEDLAVLTGATVVSEDSGYNLDNLQSEYFGQAKKISIFKDKTTVVEGAGQKETVAKRIHLLQQQLQKELTEYEREALEKRLARLSGGVAVISVGAPTEAEMKEKKDRFDDALHATKAAALEGIVVGGGVALLRAIKDLKAPSTGAEKAGFEMVKKACFRPLTLIASNGGLQGEVIAEKVFSKDQNFGYDALKDQFEDDLIKAGIIDPLLVVKSALQNAVSVASMLISAAVLISEKPKKPNSKKGSQMMDETGGMGGLGGMGDMGGMMGGMGGMF